MAWVKVARSASLTVIVITPIVIYKVKWCQSKLSTCLFCINISRSPHPHHPQAVCCKDGIHCCPHGFACDPASGTCTQESVPWLTKVPAKRKQDAVPNNDLPIKPRSDAVMCPDRRHECPEGSTCCLLQSREWGCCPLPHVRRSRNRIKHSVRPIQICHLPHGQWQWL